MAKKDQKQGAEPAELIAQTPPAVEPIEPPPPTGQQTPSAAETLTQALEAERQKWQAEQEKVLQRAISDAEARVQAAKDRELEQLRSQQYALSELAQKEKQEIEQFGDTPELKAFQQERRATQQAAKEWNARFKEAYAYKFAKDYGVDEKELLASPSIEEMQEKARRLAEGKKGSEYQNLIKTIEELKTKVEELSKPPTELDSGRYRSGGGKGKRPTLEELEASTPAETSVKVKSGEWSLPGWK